MFKGDWKDRAAEAIAREVIAKGRFEKYDLDELSAKIKRMLKEHEEQWGLFPKKESMKIKCPWCETEVSAEEYTQHYETCPKKHSESPIDTKGQYCR